jgi:N-acetylmuramoyl-L-alanine amidase
MTNGGMSHLRRLFLCLVCVHLLVGSAVAQSVTGVSLATSAKGSEVLTFHASAAVMVSKAFVLTGPHRVVIDIARVDSGRITLPKDNTSQLVKSVRFGQYDARTSRIVLDLKGPATVVGTHSGNPFTVEIMAAGPQKPERVAAPKPLIMIDAGHGGQDPGAIGKHNTHEKDITLNYAKALREALLATGRYRVQLTRDDDRFIMLPERVAMARRQKADLFISFHADSNPNPDAKGLSIYTLSENASDDESAALAERENKADIIPGMDLSGTDADVASILIDLTQRETMNKSSRFADFVVQSLHPGIDKLVKPHRYAGFRVLKAPDIPSVLIELGFLTNEKNERLLLTEEYRARVVSSVVKGIDRFYAAE